LIYIPSPFICFLYFSPIVIRQCSAGKAFSSKENTESLDKAATIVGKWHRNQKKKETIPSVTCHLYGGEDTERYTNFRCAGKKGCGSLSQGCRKENQDDFCGTNQSSVPEELNTKAGNKNRVSEILKVFFPISTTPRQFAVC
jgi:hypothetical protein